MISKKLRKCLYFINYYNKPNTLLNKTNKSFIHSKDSDINIIFDVADPIQLQFMDEMCIQVDNKDHVVAPITKRECHFENGILHRAFSVFLFNSDNELLLQKRSNEKILFPGYWANTCCSHPLYNEKEMEEKYYNGVKNAAIRKLNHELGITNELYTSDLKFVSRVLYKANYNKNWSEYEIDYILFAKSNKNNITLSPNKNEVNDVMYLKRADLECFLKNKDQRKISPWFQLLGRKLLLSWWDDIDNYVMNDTRDRKIHVLTN